MSTHYRFNWGFCEGDPKDDPRCQFWMMSKWVVTLLGVSAVQFDLDRMALSWNN